MATEPNILIWILEETLSDGSAVFNVELNGAMFSAVSEDDAEQLAEAFMNAINDHTNDIADVMRS